MKTDQPLTTDQHEPSAVDHVETCLLRYAGLLACGVPVLVLSTWPLWWQITAFPRIPFLSPLVHVPFLCDRILVLALMVCSGTVIHSVIRTRLQSARRGLAWLAVLLSFLILLDQQRCQPWAYQFCLMSALLGFRRDKRLTVNWLKIFVVGIYLHSAISKFDRPFMDTYGQNFVGALMQILGTEIRLIPVSLRQFLAGCLPAGELMVALGLSWQRTRRMAVWFGFGMHLVLLLILGPWGLGHRPGVLLWNVFFLIQLGILFGASLRTDAGGTRTAGEFQENREFPARCLTAVLVCIGLLLPVLEPWGYWDHWPSWAVYSARSPRATLYVDRSVRDRFPASLRATCRKEIGRGEWWMVDLDQWSLDVTGAPIYPQQRFRLAVMQTLHPALRSSGALHIELRGRADRSTGLRSENRIRTFQQLEAICQSCWLNTGARPTDADHQRSSKWPDIGAASRPAEKLGGSEAGIRSQTR